MRHFLFLKTVTGKGFFNLFLCSMFLVGNNDEIWGWMMMAAFGFFGIFFVAIGCACVEGYDDSDIKSKEVGDKARNSIAKRGAGDAAADDTALLNNP